MYLNKLLVEILREPIETHNIPGPRKAVFRTRLAGDLPDVTPFVYGRTVAPSAEHPDFLFRMPVQVDVYADDENTAYAVSKLVYDTLKAAHDSQTVYPTGHIRQFECPVLPWNFPDRQMPDGLVRYTAEYRLTARPA